MNFGDFENSGKSADGVVLKDLTSTISKGVDLYSKFWIPSGRVKHLPFQVGLTYSVRTNRLPGIAKLESIIHYERKSECYCLFRLYHLPEDTSIGRLAWKHGEDELLCFNEIIRLRCKDILLWLSPYKPDGRGARTFTRSNFQILCPGEKSSRLVKLNRLPTNSELGSFSVFSAVSRLLDKVGMKTERDLVPAEDMKTGNKISDTCPSEAAEKPLKPLHIPVKVLTYDEYCYFRKNKKGLEYGLILSENEAEKTHVFLDDSERDTRLFFSNATFQDKNIGACPLFLNGQPKASKLPSKHVSFSMKIAQGNKGLKRKADDLLSSPLPKIDDSKHFLEDGWQSARATEFMALNDVIVHQDTGEYEEPARKKYNVDKDVINELPLSEYEKAENTEELNQLMKGTYKGYK